LLKVKMLKYRKLKMFVNCNNPYCDE
jgi:hypothetical protein